jgi:hypothetical protein
MVAEGRGLLQVNQIINYKDGESSEDNKVVIADITVYFREKETQNQRHEVCLNYKRFGVMEQCSF